MKIEIFTTPFGVVTYNHPGPSDGIFIKTKISIFVVVKPSLNNRVCCYFHTDLWPYDHMISITQARCSPLQTENFVRMGKMWTLSL